MGLRKSRKATAEVIGTLMFVMILLFFFTDVYLWHDAATKDMNQLYLKKMNSGMQLTYNGTYVSVTALGSNVVLSRLWIDSDSSHVYADLGQYNITVAAGATNAVKVAFVSGAIYADAQGSNSVGTGYDSKTSLITVDYIPPSNAVFTIINSLGVVVSS